MQIVVHCIFLYWNSNLQSKNRIYFETLSIINKIGFPLVQQPSPTRPAASPFSLCQQYCSSPPPPTDLTTIRILFCRVLNFLLFEMFHDPSRALKSNFGENPIINIWLHSQNELNWIVNNKNLFPQTLKTVGQTSQWVCVVSSGQIYV